MGGGDLNSKKSWHPNTIKNQERVWKAEQAAAEEKKRILELQRERAEETNRSELNEMVKRNAGSSANDDNRLHWMYDKPDKKVQQEDYLLGKAIDSNYGAEKVEQDIIPAVARRVVGSSMLTTAGDAQVDLARKLREDPLLLVKERERAARAALLNNPLQRRRLTELLRKEQEQRKESKKKKGPKKKDKDLDDMLAAKLSALGGDKGLDLAALLASDDSDSSSEEEKSKKKKVKKSKHEKNKKKAKKSKEKKKSLETSDEDIESSDNKRKRHRSTGEDEILKKHKNHKVESRSQRSQSVTDKEKVEITKNRRDNNLEKRSFHHVDNKRSQYRGSSEEGHRRDMKRKASPESRKSSRGNKESDRSRKESTERKESKRSGVSEEHWKRRRVGLSEEERAAKLAEMAAAGVERERERGRRVAQQRADNDAAHTAHGPRLAFRNEALVLPDSLESRIHSNRHYIQRDQRHMNEHFARR